MTSKLSYSNKTIELCSKKRLYNNSKYLIQLQRLAQDHKLPKNLLAGIYLIETYFRPMTIRYAEYVMTVFGMIRNKISKSPFKNYTIGRCQLGVAYILKYYDKYTYKHVKKIYSLTIRDFGNIIRSMHYKENFKICAVMIEDIYKRALRTTDDFNLQLRIIGQAFNGRYSYGLLLEEVVNFLNNNEYYKKICQD